MEDARRVEPEQRALSVVLPVEPSRLPELAAALAAMGVTVADASRVFGDVPGLHFARLVMIPSGDDGRAWLALETNFDGPLDLHLDALASRVAPRARAVFACCSGFSFDDPRGSLLAGRLPERAFYLGHQGLTVETILNDRAVKRALSELLDDEISQDPSLLREGVDPRPVMQRVLGRLRRERPELELGEVPRPMHDAASFHARLWAIALFVVVLVLSGQALHPWGGAIVVAALLAPIVALAIAVLRAERGDREEIRDRPIRAYTRDELARLGTIGLIEDGSPQNALTHLVTPKPGRLRAGLLRFVLWGVDQLGKYVYRHGSLGAIPTIHFARWIILDDGRLLFFSNYDGSWESYLGDFVDKANEGLTGVWSNTREFPPTTLLAFDGARQEERFKVWTRRNQLVTQVWYSAYPDLSVRNVHAAARLRELSVPTHRRATAREWLALL